MARTATLYFHDRESFCTGSGRLKEAAAGAAAGASGGAPESDWPMRMGCDGREALGFPGAPLRAMTIQAELAAVGLKRREYEPPTLFSPLSRR
jgi:hypothetical protein